MPTYGSDLADIAYRRGLDLSRVEANRSANLQGAVGSLGDIASASGVAIEIDMNTFAGISGFTELSQCAAAQGIDVFEWVLTGGEDHAFIATTSKPIPAGATVIGKVVAGNGVNLLGVKQETSWLQKPGFTHNF